jgi:RNA polymerase sigma factor (sigma-70 family)
LPARLHAQDQPHEVVGGCRSSGLKRRGYTPKINRTKWLADVDPPVSNDEPVLDRLVREERIQQLVNAIDRLPPHQQAAIRWHLAGHDYRGISKLMGISPHTVEHHLRKARLLLFYYLGAK